jgi:hypothetical protein
VLQYREEMIYRADELLQIVFPPPYVPALHLGTKEERFARQEVEHMFCDARAEWMQMLDMAQRIQGVVIVAHTLIIMQIVSEQSRAYLQNQLWLNCTLALCRSFRS